MSSSCAGDRTGTDINDAGPQGCLHELSAQNAVHHGT